MKKEKLNDIKVIVLCIVIAFFLMFSMKANAQQISHVIDTVKYDYFDMKGRPVSSSFFSENNMGWKRWFLNYDGVRIRKVWIDTTKK